MIPFFVPEFTKEMENAAIDALKNETSVMGESVSKFEEEFARYIGTKYAISVNSGNAALHLSLISLNIGKNSKVLTSTNSFIASANCILMTGAKPVLSDISYDDGNIDVKSTNEKPDAIIPVHIYGNPCDFNSIKNLSKEYDIPIIEDACQAHGAMYNQKKVGSLGTVGCFSFYPTKNMTVCGDGGIVTTNNEEIKNKIESLRDNGRKTRTEHDKLGFTMRLNTVNASIGRIQLQTLDKKNKRRREIADLYRKFLAEDCTLSENPKGMSVYHQIVLKHKKRDEIVSHLSKNDIGVAIHYPIPIHKQPLYTKYGFSLPVSEKFSREVLSLPSYPGLGDDDVKLICEKINEVISC
jgi:perosamine synthetase